MKENLKLVNNLTQDQLDQLMNHRTIDKKPKRKTVYFKDFINKIAKGSDDVININAEIVTKSI